MFDSFTASSRSIQRLEGRRNSRRDKMRLACMPATHTVSQAPVSGAVGEAAQPLKADPHPQGKLVPVLLAEHHSRCMSHRAAIMQDQWSAAASHFDRLVRLPECARWGMRELVRVG